MHFAVLQQECLVWRPSCEILRTSITSKKLYPAHDLSLGGLGPVCLVSGSSCSTDSCSCALPTALCIFFLICLPNFLFIVKKIYRVHCNVWVQQPHIAVAAIVVLENHAPSAAWNGRRKQTCHNMITCWGNFYWLQFCYVVLPSSAFISPWL